VVLFGMKNVLPVVTACDQMIKTAFDFGPRSPCHKMAAFYGKTIRRLSRIEESKACPKILQNFLADLIPVFRVSDAISLKMGTSGQVFDVELALG
jgi:hypothetical protein